MIIKGGDDLRQEILCMQLILKFKEIFDKENLQLYLRPYEIIVTSPNSGILGIFLKKKGKKQIIKQKKK
jgi:phosphatidylinositol kinase/protein kinase (PI-3  family)